MYLEGRLSYVIFLTITIHFHLEFLDYLLLYYVFLYSFFYINQIGWKRKVNICTKYGKNKGIFHIFLVAPRYSLNEFFWRYDKKGSYLVKSSYKIAQVIFLETSPSSNTLTSKMWKILWSLVIPPKSKILFMEGLSQHSPHMWGPCKPTYCEETIWMVPPLGSLGEFWCCSWMRWGGSWNCCSWFQWRDSHGRGKVSTIYWFWGACWSFDPQYSNEIQLFVDSLCDLQRQNIIKDFYIKLINAYI